MDDWTKSAAGTTLKKKTSERSAEQSRASFDNYEQPLVLLLRVEDWWNEQKLPEDCRPRDASRISWISVQPIHTFDANEACLRRCES
jgi:hypothetical protein